MTRRPVRDRFILPPFPSGWFSLAGSDDLRAGDVRPLHRFGRDLVLFRTQAGQARVLDAACPHLGAHLGIGGTVEGNTLQCPFHGWRFDGAGRCVHAPLAQNLPRASVRSWPVEEVNGRVLVWHHAESREPDWHVPQFPETGNPDWIPFQPAQHWVIRTHCQELPENAMDAAHFPHIHRQQTASMESRGVEIDGAHLVHRTWQTLAFFGLMKKLYGEVAGPLDCTLHGLGLVVNRAEVKTKLDMAYCYPFYITPIDDEHIDVVSMLTVRRFKMPGLAWALYYKARSEGRQTIEQDIPIWEHKQFRPRPRLSDADGPIPAFRSWSAQFYPETAAETKRPAARGSRLESAPEDATRARA
jgi:phenylpropionate dioxygenase-like ring-hydroxylating dioxygenase large terminal subunit